jgi:ubiquinol-cytochrome c reductase cytochrome c1 subunit
MNSRLLRHLLIVVVLAIPARLACAQEGEIELLSAGTDIKDIESLQRGARNFMNYCSGCHSLTYVRYNRIAADLKLSQQDLANLMFTSAKVGDGIVSAMPADAAANWFGRIPPDLSLIARERGADYLFSYLKGYYVDSTRPWGVNNLYLPGVAMPDVLATLQGLQKPVQEYEVFVRDITNFLDYCGEPVKAKRESMGIFVTLFLLAGFALAYLLKKEFWKDVH